MKILHLVSDEKFIKSAKVIFTEAGAESTWLLGLSSAESVHLNYCDFPVREYYYSSRYKSIINNGSWNYIFVHGLSPEHQWAIYHYRGSAKLHLLSWGHDLYSLPKLKELLYSPSTLKIIKKIERRKFKSEIKIKLFKIIKLIKGDYFFFVSKLKILKMFDFVSTPIPNDYHLLMARYGNKLDIDYKRFNYGGFFKRSEDFLFPIALNCMIGHNGSYGNNHFDAMEFLRNQRVSLGKVYAPLSYGGNKIYIESVIKLGKESWKSEFEPLIDFVPLIDYLKILSSVRVAIFAHTRQQALGNIITLLYNGSLVFLDPINEVYRFFIENGVKVYSLKSDNILDALSTHTVDNVMKTKEFIDNYFGEEALTKNIRGIFETD